MRCAMPALDGHPNAPPLLPRSFGLVGSVERLPEHAALVSPESIQDLSVAHHPRSHILTREWLRALVLPPRDTPSSPLGGASPKWTGSIPRRTSRRRVGVIYHSRSALCACRAIPRIRYVRADPHTYRDGISPCQSQQRISIGG